MNTSARFYIAQLTADLFRREPINIGVIVMKAQDVAARFIGERTIGEIDKRHLKSFDAPDVYVQWIEYWRRILKKSTIGEAELFSANGGNFNIIMGGEVSDTDDDPASAVMNYLYPLLVSEGGFIEALGKKEEAEGSPDTALKKKVAEAFSTAMILDLGNNDVWTPRYPVRKEAPIKGKTTTHNPAYSQINGKTTIMEIVDFSTRVKAYAKDHAGFAAYIFNDIKEATGNENTDAVAIIQLASSDANNDTVQYGLRLLKNTADKIVNWSMMPERTEFIKACTVNANEHAAPGN